MPRNKPFELIKFITEDGKPDVPKNTAEVVKRGFASFNGGPHLLVNVPNGSFTITAKTSDGHKITFAFVPYTPDGPAQCVDIQHHTPSKRMVHGEDTVPIQYVKLFSLHADTITVPRDKHSLTCVIFHD